MASAYAVLSVKNAYRKVWNLMQNKILFTAPGEFDKWEQQCQPIGNGYMGASFFGGISKEKIVLNEKHCGQAVLRKAVRITTAVL